MSSLLSTQAGRTLDAFPDRIDLRDWMYQPTLALLPNEIDNSSLVPLVMDQGNQGACTGFALAAVINFLLHRRGVKRLVSPRMLYEMARCYDEWPGENYEGSSARGAMKGWARHGVCDRERWADSLTGRGHLDPVISKCALSTPCGAYFRIKHSEVRDVHAALQETGSVYCTLMVHNGWDSPGPLTAKVGNGGRGHKLPVIQRKGRADAGHAVALVGYTHEGFIVQNSWGRNWGSDGFALLPYEDFLLHATDVWVAQLGVPLSVDVWASGAADTTAGRHRSSRVISLAEVRPFIVDIGNNGELSQSGNYWTSEADVSRLFTQTIPEMAKEKEWQQKRVMLFIHGGLNSEMDTAKRVVAFREKFLENNIYPLHLMWETGPLESLNDTLDDIFTDADQRAGGGFLDGVKEAKDRVLELTAAPIGKTLWDEMKENAWRASEHRSGFGAIQLMKKYIMEAIAKSDSPKNWELHIVAHSAGSILFAHAIEHLCSLGIPLRSVQFLAPAIRIDEFKTYVLPKIEQDLCPKVILYLLNEKQELDDSVGPYGHSLLWLVSNAFEDRRGTPLLGMKHYLNKQTNLCQTAFQSMIQSPTKGTPGVETVSTTHGGFDNDPFTMNSVLFNILGRAPAQKFDDRDLDF